MRSGERLVVFLLLMLYWLLGISASVQKSNTFDEMAHIAGGYSYLHTGDYRLHPENGVLPQKFATLPLLFADVHFPSLDDDSWRHVNIWRFGFRFLFLSDNDVDRMLLSGRAMIALFGVALGLIVFLWSRQLFGVPGAFLSLLLFVFCPTMLAHGSFVTSDMASGLFLTLSVWSVWNLLNDFQARRAILAAAAIAALMLSKATWVLLVPIIPLLVLARLFRSRVFSGEKEEAVINWKRGISSAAGMAIIVYILIWSFYSFRYSAFSSGPGQFMFTWEQAENHPGKPVVEFIRQHHLLPEAWTFGFSQVIAATSHQNRLAFLNGEYSVMGWWYFFPYAFLIKTPIPLFLILGLALILWSRKSEKTRGFYETAPLWILLLVYWIFAIRSEFNLGHRYILPIYPAVYILAGGAALAFKGKSRIGKIVLAIFLGWFCVESIFIRPHYLAYFNELSGGPGNGYRHLVDSSLDWGQDLPGLRDWLESHKDQSPIYLSYFGTSSPEYYGIKATSLKDWDPSQGALAELHAGTYCISATMLQCIYNVPIAHWCAPHEAAYQELLKGPRTETTTKQLQRYRFARLAAFLRQRNYDAQIGYSILIYKLNEEEIHKALYGPPPEMRPTIEVRGLKDGRIPPLL